jgi:uncharacterized protein (TIGR00730 family)
MDRIAVFCGSNFGARDAYRTGAEQLGRQLALERIELVFGGTGRGIMGVLAAAALAEGGRVHGVATQAFEKKGHLCPGLTSLEVLETRSLRKLRMAELADGFIGLPGGLGTVEEMLEMWVDAQFNGHIKPLGLLNTEGFYDLFLRFVDHMAAEAFLPALQRGMVIVESDPARLLEAMRGFQPITTPKWM